MRLHLQHHQMETLEQGQLLSDMAGYIAADHEEELEVSCERETLEFSSQEGPVLKVTIDCSDWPASELVYKISRYLVPPRAYRLTWKDDDEYVYEASNPYEHDLERMEKTACDRYPIEMYIL